MTVRDRYSPLLLGGDWEEMIRRRTGFGGMAEDRSWRTRSVAVEHTIAVLNGDNEATAKDLATEASVTRVHADLRPEDKAALIERSRQEGPVAMVGDGAMMHRLSLLPTSASRWERWGPMSPSKPPTSP